MDATAQPAAVPALFIDRDGTIIADAHYLADASRVRLLPGAAAAVAKANAAQVPIVVVTNQSGIARGLITNAQYEAVRDQILGCRHWRIVGINAG